MSFGNPAAQDAALDIYTNADKMYLCSSEPATYAEAVSLSLADMGVPSFGAYEDYAGGRQSLIAAKTDGVGIATGSATHYALVLVGSTTLQVAKPLTAPFDVVDTEVVKTTAANLKVPNPAD